MYPQNYQYLPLRANKETQRKHKPYAKLSTCWDISHISVFLLRIALKYFCQIIINHPEFNRSWKEKQLIVKTKFPISKYKPEATGVWILLLAPVVFGWCTYINWNGYLNKHWLKTAHNMLWSLFSFSSSLFPPTWNNMCLLQGLKKPLNFWFKIFSKSQPLTPYKISEVPFVKQYRDHLLLLVSFYW